MKYKVREYEVGSIFGSEEIDEVSKLLKSGRTLAYGPRRDAFEAEFAEYCGARYAVSTTSATTALHLAMQLLQLRPGDDIVATPQTFRATYISVAGRGVQLRFADIDPTTLNIDPDTIERHVTSKTKAIYVMDYGGNPVDMAKIRDIADKHGLLVVEDAAHAPGAEYHGKKVGSTADVTCFSFHSLKNMCTFGEGGMLTTMNEELAERARSLRTMGVIGKQVSRNPARIGPYEPAQFELNDHAGDSYTRDFADVSEWGNNYRMSEVQAVVGSIQLRRLDELNAKRAAVANRMTGALEKKEGIRIPRTTPGGKNVWHLYPCFIDTGVVKASRNQFIDHLMNKLGVQIVLRYFPVHLSDYMRYYGHEYGECPVCERVWFEEQINLPINPAMPDEEIDYAVDAVKQTVDRFKR